MLHLHWGHARMQLGVVLVAACGGGATRAEVPPAAEVRCEATCEEVDFRGPLAAAGVGEDRVAVAARRSDGRVVFGVARIVRGAWDPSSLRLRPLGDGPARAVAIAASGEPAVLAVADEGGIGLHAIDGDGDVEAIGRADGALATRIDVAAREGEPALVGWVGADGAARVLAVGPGGAEELPLAPESAALDVAVAFDEDLPVAAFASPAGVVVRWRDTELRLSDRPAREVALAPSGDALLVGWAEDEGVLVARAHRGEVREAPRTVDDGSRAGEPAHRVGAALAVHDAAGRALVAHQDQTAGCLVLVEDGTGRRDVASPGRTRGMHVAIARAGGASFVLDLGAHATRDVRMTLHVTPARVAASGRQAR